VLLKWWQVGYWDILGITLMALWSDASTCIVSAAENQNVFKQQIIVVTRVAGQWGEDM
jgi:hypothetical protein